MFFFIIIIENETLIDLAVGEIHAINQSHILTFKPTCII